MTKLIALIAGILFGYGLALAGMLSPAKIVGFLDITGNWDPSLAFVMGGGLLITVVTFKFILKRPVPIFGAKFYLPTRQDIDRRLVVGSAIFGTGWAIGGLCPGPAISSLAYASPKIAIFGIAMVAGIVIAKKIFPASSS